MSMHFLTFADKRLRRSLERIEKQAANMQVFDSIKILDETHLREDFRNKFSGQISVKIRGYGFWVWKPEIIAEELKEMQNGDVLLYMDAGSHLRQEGRNRFLQYVDMVLNSDSGVLAFDSSYPKTEVMGLYTEPSSWICHYHECYKYIKSDALIFFNKQNDINFLRSPMVEAGHILICKNEKSVALIEEWRKISQNRYDLFSDSKSSRPEIEGFVEHRHDQAIFTLLADKYNIVKLSNAETFYPTTGNYRLPDWEAIKNFPLHGKRDKNFGMINKIMNLNYRLSMKNILIKLLRMGGVSVIRNKTHERLVNDSKITSAISHSEIGQDKFVINYLNYKKNGYFVEFGAANGIELSNTYMLEKYFGWKGILAEPGRVWHKDLSINRQCIIVTDCISDRSGNILDFTESVDPKLSSLTDYVSSDCHSSNRGDSVNVYKVNTVSLLDLLEKNNAPQIIDYLSIDTEGSEFLILNAFDFSRYSFRVITVEHNYTESRGKIYDLLVSNGYKRVYETESSFDDWYVLDESR